MLSILKSKTAIVIYIILAIALVFWAYSVFKNRGGKPSAIIIRQEEADNNNSQSPLSLNNAENNSASNNNPLIDENNNSSATNNTTDKNTSPVSVNENVSGSMLAHITSEHCGNNCQAFGMDLKLLEYCEEVCGISPVKKVSNCDDKSGIQKDYCLKDLAITKKDSSICEKINDANIKLTCQNRLVQDIIEGQ